MDDDRKAFPLRISKQLFDQLKAWADLEMRSINGQIEFLLREAVRRRGARDAAEDLGAPPPASERPNPPGPPAAHPPD